MMVYSQKPLPPNISAGSVVYTLRFAAVYLVWSCATSRMSRQYKANMGYLMPSRKAFLRGKAKRSATKSKKVQIIF